MIENELGAVRITSELSGPPPQPLGRTSREPAGPLERQASLRLSAQVDESVECLPIEERTCLATAGMSFPQRRALPRGRRQM